MAVACIGGRREDGGGGWGLINQSAIPGGFSASEQGCEGGPHTPQRLGTEIGRECACLGRHGRRLAWWIGDGDLLGGPPVLYCRKSRASTKHQHPPQLLLDPEAAK